MKRIVVGITGASGAIIGVELLRRLNQCPEVETHLVLSQWARTTIRLETDVSVDEVAGLADLVYSRNDQAAAISSGSFVTEGMIVAPCSMRTLAGIRTGYSDGLIGRAADVTLKERRRLVLVTRETPLSEIHLDNMLALARMGAVILPPMPAFYNNPTSLNDMVAHICVRILDQFGIASSDSKRWSGLSTQRVSAVK
jgi:flavin prenyltransferase